MFCFGLIDKRDTTLQKISKNFALEKKMFREIFGGQTSRL